MWWLETSLATCKGCFLVLQSPHTPGRRWGLGKASEEWLRLPHGKVLASFPETRAVVEVQLPELHSGVRNLSEPRYEWVPSSWIWPIFSPPSRLLEQQSEQLHCETGPYPVPAELPVTVLFGVTERRLQHGQFKYTSDPNITSVGPAKSFFRCGAQSMSGRSLQFSQ